MIKLGLENRQPSIGTRVRYLNKRVEALTRGKHRPIPRLLEMAGELEDLNEENPYKQEDEKFEKIVRKLEEEIRLLELEEDRKK